MHSVSLPLGRKSTHNTQKRPRTTHAPPKRPAMTITVDRRHFLKLLAASTAAVGAGCKPSSGAISGATPSARATAVKSIPEAILNTSPQRMPVLFVGHGSPMNAVDDNEWSQGFSQLSGNFPKPKAILAISAHWFTHATLLTANAHPATIHDFYGFPKPLYELNYPAPGNTDLAKHVRTLLGAHQSDVSNEWGLDHGTWSVLKWMYPDADVPVIQLSINHQLSPQAHWDLGRSLEALRHEGVLIFASGNVVHNLRDAMARLRSGTAASPDWAKRFDDDVAAALTQRDDRAIVERLPQSDAGRLAHPTPDHWLPLLYAVGATDAEDLVSFPIEGFDLGSISMRSVLIG